MRRLVASLAMLGLGCGQVPEGTGLDGVARQYVGMDYNTGRPADPAVRVPTLREIATQAREAESKLAAQPDGGGERGRFLSRQLHAVAARAEVLLGRRDGFNEESEALFGLSPEPEGLEDAAGARKSLNAAVPGSGSLAGRIAAFQQGGVVDPSHLGAVLGAALEACRRETMAHIALPAGEKVSVEYVHDRPWSAYSTYEGAYRSRIRVNTDYALTVDAALDLACHEGYPGHHVFNSLVDQQLVQGARRGEFSIQPTFSPQSMISESAAAAAPELTFSTDERLRIEKDVLYPLAGLSPASAEPRLKVSRLMRGLVPEELAIARDYLDGRLEFVRAETALEKRALMAHPEATLKYLNEYRSYAVTYTAGMAGMKRWMQSYPGGFWKALPELIRHPVFPANAPVTAGGG